MIIVDQHSHVQTVAVGTAGVSEVWFRWPADSLRTRTRFEQRLGTKGRGTLQLIRSRSHHRTRAAYVARATGFHANEVHRRPATSADVLCYLLPSEVFGETRLQLRSWLHSWLSLTRPEQHLAYRTLL
jgi:hypothetical protein